MSSARETLATAWLEAADDLGIEVIAPYSILGPGHRELIFPALVLHFGETNGTVVDVHAAPAGGQELATSLRLGGYFYSQVNPDVYVPYDRNTFIEMLVDWGWHNSRIDPPDWYREAVVK